MATLLTETVVVFVISLVIGAFGVHVGALVIAKTDDIGESLLTALLGAVVWGLVGRVVGAIPVVGPVLTPLVALVAYVALVKWRFDVTWLKAAGIAVRGWIVALGVLTVLAQFGLTSLEAVGVLRWPIRTGGMP